MQKESHMAAIVEYEKKLEVIQDQINKISLKIASQQRTKRMCDLSISHINSLADDKDANFFSQIDKMFIQAPRE